MEKFKRDEEEYKNNKDGKIDELRVRSLNGSARLVTDLPAGRDYGAEAEAAEGERESQAQAEGVPGCDSRVL